jgi:hypothetical protein
MCRGVAASSNLTSVHKNAAAFKTLDWLKCVTNVQEPNRGRGLGEVGRQECRSGMGPKPTKGQRHGLGKHTMLRREQLWQIDAYSAGVHQPSASLWVASLNTWLQGLSHQRGISDD